MNNIEILEEFLEQYNASYPEEKECVAIYPNQIEAIENLIKGYKELDKENTRQHELLGKIHEKYQKDYIPKSKVKEKIEKIKILAEKADDETLNVCELDIRKNQIYLLKSLLEKGE